MARKKKDKLNIILIVIIAILLIGGGAYFLRGFISAPKTPNTADLLRVELYNDNYVKLSDSQEQLFAVVNNIPNIRYAKFFVTTQNTGNVNYIAKVVSAEPAQLVSALHIPAQAGTIVPNQTYIWSSEYIDLNQFPNTTTNFKVVMTAVFDTKSVINKTGSISLTIIADNVSINTGGSGDSSTNQTNQSSGSGNAGTDLCSSKLCRSFCEGTTWNFNGYCRIDNISHNNLTWQEANCYYWNKTFYSSSCGWDIAYNISCGDGFCNGATNVSASRPYECCYQPEVSKRYECKSGVPLCSDINGECNRDCMNPEDFAQYIIGPIQLG